MKSKNKEIYRRIWKFLRPYRLLLVLSLILAVISVIFTLYAPVLMGEGIDLIVAKGLVDFPGLAALILRYALVMVLTAVAQWLMNLCNNKITYHVVRDIRTQAFCHLEELPLKYIDGKPYGEVISRIINDIDQFSDGLLLGFSQLFTGVITIIGTLGFMLSIHAGISLFVVVMTPLSLFVASFIAKRTFSMFKAQSETRADLTGLVEELVGNQKIVKAFSYEKEAEERFEQVNERLRVHGLKATFFSSLTNPCTRFVNNLVYAGVAVIGAILGVQGLISVGQISSFLSYANQYTKPFNEISNVFTELQTALACASRVFHLLDIDSSPKQGPTKTLSHIQGHVQIQHLSFSYRDDEPFIEDFNVEAKPGQTIAIVGPTGCGKTTFINLLMKFYQPQHGQICIDGIDIQDMSSDYVRSLYGMVLQDSWLFQGSIRDNIAYGKKEATDQEIIEAAKKAHAHKFIIQLKDGYDTMISEEGGNLSQGQKQLLCIARIMLVKPPMLILDEATSSIDTRTEKQIQEAFDLMMEGRTTFIVAHRLSTIQKADQILVMNHGQIIEQGKHEELLKKYGFYHHLYYSQFEIQK